MGMRQRWLLYTSLVAGLIGTLCVLLVASFFSGSIYASREAEILEYVDTANAYFNDRVNKSESDFYEACVIYTQTCDTGKKLDLQFVNVNGEVVASSAGEQDGQMPCTTEIAEAISSRGVCTFAGKEPVNRQGIMAVSSPLIATSGEVIGVLRFVTPTSSMDRQIVRIAVSALAIVIVMIALMLLTVNFYVQSVLKPVMQISEKARMIAGGSYGIQIPTKFDDELGELAETINEMSM